MRLWEKGQKSLPSSLRNSNPRIATSWRARASNLIMPLMIRVESIKFMKRTEQIQEQTIKNNLNQHIRDSAKHDESNIIFSDKN